jgi:tetratricopeptide (TPR) repeat protein
MKLGKLAKRFYPALLMALSACSSAQDGPKDPPLTADPPSGGVSADDGAATTELERGVAFIKNQKFKDAEEHLARSLQLKPSGEASFYLGVAKEKDGDKAGAEEAYKQALKADAKLTEAAGNLGALYLDQQPPKVDEAIAVLTAAIGKGGGGDGELRLNLAYAYGVKGDVDSAAKQYEAALGKGEDAQIRFAYGAMLFDNKQLDRAAEQLKKTVDGLKDDGPTLATLGAMLGTSKAYPECVKAYDRAIKLKASDPDLFIRRATCKHLANDEAGSEADFQQAIKIDPKNGIAHYRLALTLLGEKKRAAGVKELETAAGLGGDIGKMAKTKLEEIAKKK